ncbi:MAG TPA: PLP-dependent aminotransferase family protein, partial [Paenibacillus sp.]|nr:PLP-dependent aminotransferase family protein [Paenibacillus sp.]
YEPHPTGLVEQLALAAFMKSGAYERHLRRMKRVYSRKYELLSAALRERLGHVFETRPQDAGLHIYARWTGTREAYESLIEACEARGVAWSDVSHERDGEWAGAAAFGFAGVEPAAIVSGIEAIAAAEAELRKERR